MSKLAAVFVRPFPLVPPRSSSLAPALLLAVAVGAFAACGPGDRSRAAPGDEPGGPAPIRAGDPEQRLAEEGLPPIDEDDCGLEEGPPVVDPELDPGRAAGLSEFARAPVSFTVRFQDEVNPYSLMSAFVMPGETLDLAPTLTDPRSEIRVAADAGSLQQTGSGRWRWTAPEEPGIHCVTISDAASGETMCVNVFVMTPWDGSEVLNGYRIGSYPKELYKGLETYSPPTGFIEVTEETQHAWVSPHFQLKQFVCKQAGGFPKYLVLKTRLLLKLERLLTEVREEGVPVESFYVMSGYRTPFYNGAIGNQTSFSRHTHGDAADIFVDRDRDGVMDDIDGSGSVTVGDARRLARLIESLRDRPWYRPFVGGLGIYGPAPHRGPFVHVDTRGFPARW